jgi:hypothetical protein
VCAVAAEVGEGAAKKSKIESENANLDLQVQPTSVEVVTASPTGQVNSPEKQVTDTKECPTSSPIPDARLVAVAVPYPFVLALKAWGISLAGRATGSDCCRRS